jgi:hypothetical protein
MTVGGRNKPHFMVLIGMDDNFVYVNDPGKTHGANNKYTINQFMKAWQSQHSAVVTIHSQATTPCTPPGMVGLWLGEGNANDAIAAHNGSIFNGVTFAPGEVGQSFSFNGTDGHVRIPHNASFNSQNALTLEAWIFPTQFAVPSATFLGKWDSVDGVNQRSYPLNINELGEFVFYLNTDGSH